MWDRLERTAVFGERLVRFSKRIRREPPNNRFIERPVGAGTNIGPNYSQANQDVSKKDVRFSFSHCVKEAKETKFFRHRVVAAKPALAAEARPLYREAHELLCVFAPHAPAMNATRRLPAALNETSLEPDALTLELLPHP